MKFLMFNLIVGIALIYLFSGNREIFQAMPDAANAAADIIKTKMVAINGTPEQPKKEAPRKQAIISLANAKPKAASDLTLADVKPRKLNPAILKRRKEIMETTAKSPPETTAQGTGSMSRRDRQQALLQLAEDMELYSVKAMSR